MSKDSPQVDQGAISAINQQAAFNRWAGFEVLEVEPGRVRIAMPWREEVGQYSGFLHAGLVGALLDTACGYAAATRVGRVLASHFSVNCLAPAVGERFIAEGRVIRAGRKQVFARGELFSQPPDGAALRLVATGDAILVPTEAA